MGSDGCDTEGAEGVPPSSVLKDCRDVILASRGGGVVVVIGGEGLVGGGSVANEGIHLYAAGYHCVIYLKFIHL